LIDNSAVQPISSCASLKEDLSNFKACALNPEDNEVDDESSEESLGGADFNFIKHQRFCDVMRGQSANQAKSSDKLPPMPLFSPNINYYELYWEMYLRNESVMAQIANESAQRDTILQQILLIEEFYNDTENLERGSQERYISGRKKHHRRCANEIKRQLECPYPKCCKLYGSEGSLNLHIKIKHNGGNKTDREKIAKSIVIAKVNGLELSDEIQMNLNLPPGSLEKAAQSLNVDIDHNCLQKLEKNVLKCNEESEKQKKKEMLKRKDKLLISKEPEHMPDSPEQPQLAPRKQKKARSYSSEGEHSM
jgi:hypothetical protein